MDLLFSTADPFLFIHNVFRLGCRLTTGTTVRHPVHLHPTGHCRFIFFEPKRLQPVLLMERCDDDELLLLLLLIVVGLLILVEVLADCTRSRVSRGGDVAVEAVDSGEVMVGTIVLSDSTVDIIGLEDVRPEEVCGRDGRVDDDEEADDGGAEKDAGRVTFGRGPGLQANGEMGFLYSVQYIAGMVVAFAVYAGCV